MRTPRTLRLGSQTTTRPLRLGLLCAVTALVLVACAQNTPEAEDGDSAARVEPAKNRASSLPGAALDVHMHLASQHLADIFTGGEGGPVPDADDLIAKLDEANVDRGIVLSGGFFGAWAGLTPTDMASENDYAASEVARYPDRLMGFCGINPLFTTAIREIGRCLRLPGMIGVKLHLEGSGTDMTDPDQVYALNKAFDRIARADAPVLIHIADQGALPLQGQAFSNMAEILDTHPDVRVAHAHCAGGADDDTIETWLRVNGSGYNPETSFVDISACLAFFRDAPKAQRQLMVWRLRKWGIDHVLFGSDYFAFSGQTPRETLDILADYPFTKAEMRTILTNDGSSWLGS